MNFKLKTILGIALIQSVLLVILILSVINFLKSSHEEEIHHRAVSTSKLFSSMIKNAVLTSDIASLKTFVKDVLSNQDIVYARIIGDDGVLAEGGNQSYLNRVFVVDASLDEVNDDIFDVQAEIKEYDYLFATVQLGFSINRITNVLNKAKEMTSLIAIFQVLLVGFFSFILGGWLTKQLTRLKEASDLIGQQGPGLQIEATGNDEISVVSKAFNNMSANLHNSYKELKDYNLAYKEIAQGAMKNEAFTQATLNSSMDAIITIDSQGIVIEYNKVAEEIFGYPRNEIMGQLMHEWIIPEAYRELHQHGIQTYNKNGHGPVLNQRVKLEALHQKGHTFAVELNISDIQVNEQVFFTAFIKDITEEEKNRQELMIAASAFEANEAIFISDSNNHIVRVNRAFLEITGYTQEEVQGQNPRLLSSGQQEKTFYQNMWQKIVQEGYWEGEINNRRKNGDVFPEWLTITAVKDNNEKIINYVAHFVDLTKRKKAEEKLLLAKQEAEQASEAKSQFLATMSHEIRTPLNAVIGVLTILKDETLHQDYYQFVETADTAANSLLSIINDILDFSKIEAGKMELKPASFSLHKLILSLMNMMSSKVDQQSIDINYYLDSKVPERLMGDSGKIKQVLINIVNNAIKFTHQGQVSINIQTIALTEQACQLKFSIIDTGIGIEKNKLSLLFRDFSQIEQNSDRKYEGTGLGLAISQKLIQLMGSQITVDSKINQGSTFSFILDFEIVSSLMAQQDELQTTNENIFHDADILLVEDNQANIIVAETILTKQGYRVDIALNGFEAIKQIQRKVSQSQNYDIILMDLMMPEMDGFTALKAIRNLDSPISSIPVIAMTANASEENKEYCFKEGFDGFISKPFNKKDLFLTLHHHLKDLNINDDKHKKWNSAVTTPSVLNSESQLLKRSILEQLAEDTSVEIIPEMISIFIQELERRLDPITQANETSNADIIGEQVHAIKSSAGTYGAIALQDLCVDIDLCYKKKDFDNVLKKADNLPQLIKETIQEYQEFKL